MKVFKKMISILLVLVLCTSYMSFSSQAATASGTCGENLTWTQTEDGMLTISGTGEMGNGEIRAPWAITSVVIEEGVTSIGYGAFRNCTDLTNVTLPGSLTSISSGAFSGCSNLTSIVIEEGVTCIGNSWFSGCSGLVEVTIPASVTSIEWGAFMECSNLTNVMIPESVTSIDMEAFYNCSSLEGFWVDEHNPNYSSDDRGVLFNKEKTELLQAPDSLKGDYSIPESVTSIAGNAFEGCSGLTSVMISANVSTIKGIAFAECENLTGIWVDENNTNYSNDANGVLFDKEKTELIKAPEAINGAYDIPSSVISIGTYAFEDCRNLTAVTVPASVVKLGRTSDVSSIEIGGEGVFENCVNLKRIWVNEENANYSSDARGVLFNKEKTELIKAPGAIGNVYIIPEGVNKIRSNAFNGCGNLTCVTIPQSVTYIDYWAFCQFDDSISVIFYGDAPKMNYYAFGGQYVKGLRVPYVKQAIATVYYPAGNESWDSEITWDFYGTTETTDVKINYGGDLTWIPYDEILEGADNIWDSNNSEDLTVRVEKDFSELESVSVDGQTVDPANYDVSEQSVTFHSDYLETLAAGERIVIIQFTDGVAITTLTIQPSTGDVNGDGEVNNKDLTRLFQYLSDWDVTVNEKAMDVNGDGSINNKDLTRLFQYLSNWDVEIH